ncbi:DUF4871 domain-containing protein [Aneurinibacillus sp. REN35]|uniref:DUF4871 domain-containing protein n=1 Tax=Aneurinibacillus sp. REN35 TaxID=3237286 RepID=UPI0035286208
MRQRIRVLGRVGIIGNDIDTKFPDLPPKWLWHFWGKKEELQDKKLKVVAIHKDTGEEADPLGKYMTEPRVTYSDTLVNGSHATMPSNVSLPRAGLWKVKVYLDEAFFAEFIIEVK